jgi:hypothetical protein
MLADTRSSLQSYTIVEWQKSRKFSYICYKYAIGHDNNLYQVFESYYEMMAYWEDNPEIEIHDYSEYDYKNACLVACNIEK